MPSLLETDPLLVVPGELPAEPLPSGFIDRIEAAEPDECNGLP
jgi:hypothetical protein